MMIKNVQDAVAILDDGARDPLIREAAGRYIQEHLTEQLIPRTVLALQDDDEGVRRAAARGLIGMGITAWPDLLLALMDGKRGGDSRLRRGAHHVLHQSTQAADVTAPLLRQLQGISSSDISAMIEADRLYKRMATNPVFAARLAAIRKAKAESAAAPKEPQTMGIPVDAGVDCSDGFAGYCRYVVINPVVCQVTHIVVEEKDYPYYARLVPLDQVQETTRQLIRLRCTARELAEQKVFIDTEFVSASQPYLAYTPGEYALWPYVPGLSVPPMSIEHEQIPPGELSIQRGNQVLATDGPVGRVDEFLVAPRTGNITHLVLREGHWWGQRDVTIPVAQIDHLEADTVTLKLDKQAIDALPAVPVGRWPS